MAINCNKKENKPQERQMMLVIHGQTTDAQPVPEQQPAVSLPPALYTEHDSI